MSLAGVRSNRGDSYQTLVSLDWALSIIASDIYLWLEVDSTSLDDTENPISVDDIVISCADGSLICCQCKKNQIDFKDWSIDDLDGEIQKAAKFLTKNLSSQVNFYSRSNFGAIAKLREHARTQPNETAYQNSLSKEHQKTNTDLAKCISKVEGISTYAWLQRTTFNISEEFERYKELLMERLRHLGPNADIAFSSLWTTLDMLGARINGSQFGELSDHRLTKSDLLEVLEKSGVIMTPVMSQASMQQSFASVSAVGRHWRREIAGKRVHVDTVTELISVIESTDRSILLSGIPGSGKTCVLLELQETLEKRKDLAPLFIQSREYANYPTPEARIAHGLPEDLVGLVARMANDKPTVVIIDSLDVLSLSREHIVLSYFLALIDRLLLIPKVTVIAACRDFDRKYDRRLAERKWARIINNKPLDWNTVVAPLIEELGIDIRALAGR